MRLGSLGILAAFVLFGALASRLRPGFFGARPNVGNMRIRLRIAGAAGPRADREVVLDVRQGAPVFVGRSSGAQVGVPDPEVSRSHAQFDLDRGVLYLADCGSSNGTFLNGKRVDEHGIEVRPGDDIDVGNTRITITGTEPISWT
jgi:pSer/pThr/pTyr-binding forkhead associated (FHA) protein